jgi:HEAT repeats
MALFGRPDVEKLAENRDVPGLIKAMGHRRDPEVCPSAAEALGKIGDASAVEPLIEALGSDDRVLLRRVAWALGAIGDRRAVEPLAKALAEDALENRLEVAIALGRMGDARAVEPLLEGVDNLNWQSMVVPWLARLRDRRAVEPLLALLKAADASSRRLGAQALGLIGDARSVEPLIAALGDDDVVVRRAAVDALGIMHDPRAERAVATIGTPDDESLQLYRSKKRGLSLRYPQGWETIWENEPDGGWEIVVGIAGRDLGSGRPCVTIRIYPDVLINFSDVSVFAAGGPGAPVELPRTLDAYVDGCKAELRKTLRGLDLVSSGTGTVADLPAATLVYEYDGSSGKIVEKQINVFSPTSTYRFLAEAPKGQVEYTNACLDAVITTLRLAPGK